MAPSKKHSQYSPSAATRWMGCPGSTRRIKHLIASGQYEETRSSVYAAEGTAAHLVREYCLMFGFEPHDFIGTVIEADGFKFTVDDEMADSLLPGIDRIREFKGNLIVEARVDTTPWVGVDDDGDKQGGTIDAAVIAWDECEIVMSDLKYGMGAVEAVGNKQTRVYMLALLREMQTEYPDVDWENWKFRIIIDQPRNPAGGGEWVITYYDLWHFGEEVREATKASRDPDAPCKPGKEICQWCPAAQIDNACPEHEAWKLDILGLEFDDLDAEDVSLPDREGITPERRTFILRNWPVIETWYKRLHAEAIEDALEGREVPGLKAVEGRRPLRKHKDEAQSEAFMRQRGLSDDKIFTKKLISPAQAEKALKLGQGNFPKRLIEQGDPKPVLVPVEDERPAIVQKTEFDNLDADDIDDI